MFKSKNVKSDISKRHMYRRIAIENRAVFQKICSNSNHNAAPSSDQTEKITDEIQNSESTDDLDFLSFSTPDGDENYCQSNISNTSINCLNVTPFVNVDKSFDSDHEAPKEFSFDIGNINEINLTTNLREWALKTKASHHSITSLLKILAPLHPELPLDSSHEAPKEFSFDIGNINEINLTTNLREWALKTKASHHSITSLLKILAPLHPELPLDSRSLLKTPRVGVFKALDNGEYCHFGIENALKKLIPSSSIDERIKLSVNIDGIPLFASTNVQFWPILGMITNFPSSPFAIGVFCGKSKPLPLDIFLENFINEYNKLKTSGILLHGKIYFVEILNFICDAPAKAYLKGIKSHGGYSSCEKCWEFGDYNHKAGKVIFKGTSSSLRTDEQFVLETDEEHHKEKSPLLKLNIGLVSSFTIDYMHAVCLGVMKKMLVSLISGGLHIRIGHATVEHLSENLLYLRQFIPSEFNRKPRSLSELSYWKATEFRNFLLYFGPFVLKDNIDIAVFEHFLLLHVAIFVLASANHLSSIGAQNAHKILETFIEHCDYVYGPEFYVYNTHILCHLAEESKRFGTLDSFSAFPFENFLGFIKSCIRSPQKPLQQIFRRLIERDCLYVTANINEDNLLLSIEHSEGPILELSVLTQYKKIMWKSFTLTGYSMANAYFMTKFGDVVELNNICTIIDRKTMLIGKKFLKYESFYVYPLDSKDLGIYVVSNLSSTFEVYSFLDLKFKCLVFPNKLNDSTYICFPLLHDMSI